MIGTARIGIWRPPQDYGARYRGDPRRFSAYGLAGMWDPSKPSSITLNGTDVVTAASLVAGGIDVTQGTAARQPLYTGAPTYNGQQSIQFTRLNTDFLERANTNLIGTGPVSYVLVMRARNNTPDQVYFGNDLGGAPFGGTEFAQLSSNRDYIAVAGAGSADGAISTTVAEAWVSSDPADGTTPGSFWVGGSRVTTPTFTHLTPGAAGSMMIGARQTGAAPADIDFLLGAIFTAAIGDTVAWRISKAMGARFGVAG